MWSRHQIANTIYTILLIFRHENMSSTHKEYNETPPGSWYLRVFGV